MHVPSARRGHQMTWNYTYGELWAAIWVLGMEPRFSGRAARPLNHSTISPATPHYFKEEKYMYTQTYVLVLYTEKEPSASIGYVSVASNNPGSKISKEKKAHLHTVLTMVSNLGYLNGRRCPRLVTCKAFNLQGSCNIPTDIRKGITEEQWHFTPQQQRTVTVSTVCGSGLNLGNYKFLRRENPVTGKAVIFS